MPPVRVLLIDDLVMRAEALALGLSAHSKIVVVGRLRVHDPQLAQRCAAAPADVAVVALVDARDFEAGTPRHDGGNDSERADSDAETLLARVTKELVAGRPGMRLVALVDPRDTKTVTAVERSDEWSWVPPCSSLDDLVAVLLQSVDDPAP